MTRSPKSQRQMQTSWSYLRHPFIRLDRNASVLSRKKCTTGQHVYHLLSALEQRMRHIPSYGARLLATNIGQECEQGRF